MDLTLSSDRFSASCSASCSFFFSDGLLRALDDVIVVGGGVGGGGGVGVGVGGFAAAAVDSCFVLTLGFDLGGESGIERSTFLRLRVVVAVAVAGEKSNKLSTLTSTS